MKSQKTPAIRRCMAAGALFLTSGPGHISAVMEPTPHELQGPTAFRSSDVVEKNTCGSGEPIPWSEIGARATAHYDGEGLAIVSTADGAILHSIFQQLWGEATPEGFWLNSTAEGAEPDRLQVMAATIQRSPFPVQGSAGSGLQHAMFDLDPSVLVPSGEVRVEEDLVRFIRPGLVEEYSTSMDGVRQDFLVLERPDGDGELRVDLHVLGARAEEAPFGARLTLKNSGRKLAYSRLQVEDGAGRVLPARMEVNAEDRLSIFVADAGAAYPIRIDPTFSDENWTSMGDFQGANSTVNAMVFAGDGVLYVSGGFTMIGDIRANRIARWDGSAWSALGSGVGGGVTALAVSGGGLYVGGWFTSAGGVEGRRGVARWAIGATDDSGWSSLGSGLTSDNPSHHVTSLAVSGGDLFVGGVFTSVGGVEGRNCVARWTIGATGNSGWSGLGSGVQGGVHALAVREGTLFVGGNFYSAGNLAQWAIGATDNSGWSGLGSGVNSTVRALVVSGDNLYVGGDFSSAGGVPERVGVARWTIGSTDDSGWSGLGSGAPNVHALAVSGGRLYVGRLTANGGALPGNRVARWTLGAHDDSGWSSLGSGVNNSVYALAVSDGGLYAGGAFTAAGGVQGRNRLAYWAPGASDDNGWSGFGSGVNGTVFAWAASGGDIYLGGDFTAVGPWIPANRVARWDGSTWSALGSGVNDTVHVLTVSGDDVYVGGAFASAGGVEGRNHVARWAMGSSDDSGWSGLGSGLNDTVHDLAASGDELYVGGAFTSAGVVEGRNHVARWAMAASDDSGWSGLGSGTNDTVHALAVSGDDLYVGGAFTSAGGIEGRNHVARWAMAAHDDSGWFDLGSGTNNNVFAMVVSAGDLYVGGAFTSAGGPDWRSRVARWTMGARDDEGWSGLGAGVGGTVYALAISPAHLYVGGSFLSAGGFTRYNVARWTLGTDNTGWAGLGAGVSARVNALGASEAHLYVGGIFITAGDKISPRLAKADLPSILAVTHAIVDEKTYDGTRTATIQVGDLVGVKPGDDVSLASVAGTFAQSLVGDGIAVTARLTLTGADAGNYAVIQPTGLTGNIVPREIRIVDFLVASKTYDGTRDVSAVFFYDDRVAGDDLEFSFEASFDDASVGENKPVQISNIAIGGAAAGNYMLGTTSLTATANITNPQTNGYGVVMWGHRTFDARAFDQPFVQIAAGAFNTVAVKSDGTVAAWGQNAFGESDVPAGLTNVTAVAAGSYHTVALKSDGTVVVWGLNNDIPAGLSNIIAIDAGHEHTVALKDDGRVVSWGHNNHGQTNVPGGLIDVTAVAAGRGHTVALRSNGTVAAWGDNTWGQCNVPAGLENITAIAAGHNHTVALKKDGTVVAWGNNDEDQANIPSGLGNVIAISAGWEHTSALRRDGTVVSWGNNGAGQADVPEGLGGAIAIGAGGFHTVALVYDGTVLGWGGNAHGQADAPAGFSNVESVAFGGAHTLVLKTDRTVVAWGFGYWGETEVPAGLQDVAAVAAGLAHTVALKTDGTVVAWGDNELGQTGIPLGLSNVIAIAASGDYTLALRSDGTVAAWGDNAYGQTVVPAGLGGVTAIAAGTNHAVALKSDGSVIAWGRNSSGQTDVPASLEDVTAIAARGNHTVALKTDGTVVAWGGNTFGQTNVPPELENVAAVAAGDSHTIVLKTDGTVVAWGQNSSRQISLAAGLTNVANIVAGIDLTVALVSRAPNVVEDFAIWTAGFGLFGSAADPAADPAGDGIPNLLAYLFNVNPVQGRTPDDMYALPVVGMTHSNGQDYLTLIHRRNRGSRGLIVTAEWSETLEFGSWTLVTPDFVEEVGDDPVTGDPLIEIKINVTGSDRLFLRLQARQ